MAETVLVSTHDLPLAGALRTGFRAAGHRVEFVTPHDNPDTVAERGLLVLTGGLEAGGAAALAEAARNHKVPVFAVGAEPGSRGLAMAFPAGVDAQEVVLTGCRALDRRRLREATGIIGETDPMIEVLERVVQIAPVDVTVLVTGESGTGKELVARGLHALSKRRQKAFMAVNVAALTETLLESELFGHEKGAFTGAIDSRRGLFELASGGTIFLDEIGEMPLQTQTKLLRVLEQREFLRVGGQKVVQVDVRIVAATNQRLRDMVAQGTFRRDLYYRLNVLHIALPPLRRRREDIPLLVDAFVRDASKRHDRGPFAGISADAMDILVRHRWPGNVRELRNLIESMVVLAPGREIRAEDIPSDFAEREPSTALAPLPGPDAAAHDQTSVLRPQLEFVFRTMMQMKVDIEDLRTEFEAFRRSEAAAEARLLLGRAPDEARPDAAAHEDGEIVYDRTAEDASSAIEVATAPGREPSAEPEPFAGAERPPVGAESAPDSVVRPRPGDAAAEPTPVAESGRPGPVGVEPPPGSVVYRAGMTLEEAERATIAAALESASGNRRIAAESLGIGERTLYRKIDTLGLEV